MTGKSIIRFILAVFFAVFLICPYVQAADTSGGSEETRDVPTGQTGDAPTGQTDQEPEGREIGADIFGREGGYFHPFLFLEGKYTDNLYYTRRGKEDDFITSAAPGIWVAVPANREQLLEIATSPTSPGGLQVSRIKPQSNRRMQSYFLYSPKFVDYANNSEHDHVSHRAEGLFQYNFDMGLSLDVIDLFNNEHIINNNAAERLDEYYDNLANVLLTYSPSDRLKLRLDLSNYWLEYQDRANEFRNRTDNSVAAYIFYRILPKTSVFGEYAFSDIKYDEFDYFDSKEHRYYAGVDWEITAKSRGRVKAGYMEKKFDSSSLGDESGFSAEVQVQHNFNPKREASLTAYHRYTESSMATSYTVLTTGVNFALMQRFTPKWSLAVQALYYNDDYQGDLTLNGVTKEREDDTFRVGPELIFEPRDWLEIDLGYYFSKRESNFDMFEFENNTIYLSIELAL
ncbi:MAG: outer membrane beta-barrel protein [Desulfobacteraceae bacterium]|nr:outer membrane beta-barrel protein [Desulfobacteraceae bacterium]